MGCSRALAALAALALTAACREGVEVVVQQDAGGVRFVADPVSEDFDACIKTAYLYVEEAGRERQLWYATRGIAHEPCIGTLRYAANPPGFSADPPPGLEAGKRYRVALLGSGFNASARFTAGQ